MPDSWAQMKPDELLSHLEAELARATDERDRLSAEREAAVTARDLALVENARSERALLALQAELDAAEGERDRLYGELDSLLGSKSWFVTKPLRRLFGSDRPEAPDPPEGTDGGKPAMRPPSVERP
jgi:hypothetical protein